MTPNKIEEQQLQKTLLSYQLLTTRELEKGNKIWQAPVMGMAAQAFLLTIALSAASKPAAGAITAGLAALLAAVALQITLKHRWWQQLHRAELAQFEDELGLRKISNFGVIMAV